MTHWKVSRRTGWLVVALLVTGALLALVPAAAMTQTPYAQGVLYEVREDVNCNPGTSTSPTCPDTSAQGFGVRLANATLLGGVAPFPGGVQGPPEFTGTITINASSVLSQVDWTGPIHGKFSVANVKGSTVTGTLSGQLDLSPAIFGGVPIARVSGHWHGTKGTLQAGGTFSGAFLVPFGCPLGVGACYLKIDPATEQVVGVEPVQFPSEFVFIGGSPTPLVKLLVTLFQ
jgi:hypothetical protein